MAIPPPNYEPETTTVIIVGAGPSGLATAACLTKHSIPYVLLERDGCVASLWQTKAYDRLRLHHSKPFVELPHFPIPKHYPKYLSRDDFAEYLTTYAALFNICPRFHRLVTLARHDDESGNWHVKARINTADNKDGEEEYVGRFMVVATGEMTDPYIPKLDGLTEFPGEVMHSTLFKSGKEYTGKNVLVVGYGNSGLEIALDLTTYGANTSIVIRGKEPVHMLKRSWLDLGRKLWKYLPESVVDSMIANLSKIVYKDLVNYGFAKPPEIGPFAMMKTGKYPLYDDVGTIDKIRSGEIKVFPAIEYIKGNEVMFLNGELHPFDAIIFATGFRMTTHKWLQGNADYIREDSMPKEKYPNCWKGKNGFYFAGLSRVNIAEHGIDALKIADHVKSLL